MHTEALPTSVASSLTTCGQLPSSVSQTLPFQICPDSRSARIGDGDLSPVLFWSHLLHHGVFTLWRHSDISYQPAGTRTKASSCSFLNSVVGSGLNASSSPSMYFLYLLNFDINKSNRSFQKGGVSETPHKTTISSIVANIIHLIFQIQVYSYYYRTQIAF